MRALAAYVPALEARPSGEGLLSSAEVMSIARGLAAFGPTLDMPDPAASDGLFLVDVTGCSGLFGPHGEQGERALLQHVVEFFRDLGFGAHVAIAEGPRLAIMFAKLADRPRSVSRDETRGALAALPLALLPLHDTELRYFLKLGFASVRDLLALPRAALAARLEPRRAGTPSARCAHSIEDLLLLLHGDDRAPLCAFSPQEPLRAQLELPHPTDDLTIVVQALRFLTEQLWPKLVGLSVRKLSLRLVCERGPELIHQACFTPALSYAADVVAVLHEKLQASARQAEAHEPARIAEVSLCLDETVPSVLAALELYSSEARVRRALPKLLAELEQSIGVAQVGRLEVVDAWELHERSSLVPYGEEGREEACDLNVLEPTRLCPAALSTPVEAVRLILRLERESWFVRDRAPVRRELLYAFADTQAVCALRSAAGTRVVGWFD